MDNEQITFYASPTKLSTFLECPRKYWYYYLNPPTRYKQPEYPYFTLGNTVHDTLKYFFMLKPPLRTKEKLLEMLERFWGMKTGIKGGFKSEEEEKRYKERAVSMLNNFFQNEDTILTPLIWQKSKNPQAQITPNLFFNGVFDRLDQLPNGNLHVIDYKTGKEDAEDGHNLQLPMYALMAEKIFQKKVSLVSFLNLESGNWDTKELEPSYSEEVLRRVQKIISWIPDSFEKDQFRCKSEKCNHCDYLIDLGFSIDDRLSV